MKSGPPPAPRRRLHPELIERVRSSRTPVYQLGRLAGWAHGREVSYLTQPGNVVAATPLTVTRLRLLANIVGHPADQIFADPEMGAGLA